MTHRKKNHPPRDSQGYDPRLDLVVFEVESSDSARPRAVLVLRYNACQESVSLNVHNLHSGILEVVSVHRNPGCRFGILDPLADFDADGRLTLDDRHCTNQKAQCGKN
jgi:hypothetical protein